MAHDTTRDRILSMIVSQGPIAAATIAESLGVTSAGVRRHLIALADEGLITDHEPPGQQHRGRGRPARSYVATTEGQSALESEYADVAVDAMGFLRQRGDLVDFVEAKAAELEAAVVDQIPVGAPMEERVNALSDALAEHGYATSVRPGPGGYTVQLCQGHCPVQSIAEATPEWCEAETRAFSRLLDVHVQRLSTLAGGAHVCTTTIPVSTPKER